MNLGYDLNYDETTEQNDLDLHLVLLIREVLKPCTSPPRIRQMMHATELQITPKTWMVEIEKRMGSLDRKVRDTVIGVAVQAISDRFNGAVQCSPLTLAVLSDCVELASHLIDAGADAKFWEDSPGDSLLVFTVRNPKMFELLLRAGASPHVQNPKDKTTVLFFFVKYADTASLKRLVDLGVDVNQVCTKTGGSIINEAARNGFLSSPKLEVLLKAGADVLLPLRQLQQSPEASSIPQTTWRLLHRAAFASLIMTMITCSAFKKTRDQSPVAKLPSGLLRMLLKTLNG
jgi:hypothetical protein